MKTSWDVIVVGAGAAGLFAAAAAANCARSTLLVEKNKKLGVKILMSGGTRCNITQDTDWQGIADAFGQRQGRFLKHSLASLPPEQIVNQFHQWGVPTKVEPLPRGGGKVFPCSDRAIDVRDALVEHARSSGVTIINETAVTGIRKLAHGFELQTDKSAGRQSGEQPLTCDSLVVTCGGQSYPGCGTTGDGYRWLQELGHTVVAPRPALTPIRVADLWVRDLAGLTMPDMSLCVKLMEVTGDKKTRGKKAAKKQSGHRDRYRGSFLFTHKGCSGPTVLNVSRVVTDPANNVQKDLVCDWLPEIDEEQLRRDLGSNATRSSGKQLGNYLGQKIPKRLAASLCERAEVAFDQPMAELGRKQLSAVVGQLKRCSMNVAGTLGFAKAEVTAGGICLDEVDRQTMASKRVSGLYLAGEILDVDGPIGGYNFQAAFSTGFVAGSNA